MAYTLPTQAKINYLLNLIDKNPDWGSSRLQNAIKERFGSALKKNYLLKEAAAYRQEQKIMPPRETYGINVHLRSIFDKGGYTDFERKAFLRQINEYSKEGMRNFIYSETLKKTAEQHAKWLESLLKEALKITNNLRDAKALVYERLNRLFKQGEYDPFTLLKEQEQIGAIMSGVIKIRKMRHEYTLQRREDAKRRRQLVKEKVLERQRFRP